MSDTPPQTPDQGSSGCARPLKKTSKSKPRKSRARSSSNAVSKRLYQALLLQLLQLEDRLKKTTPPKPSEIEYNLRTLMALARMYEILEKASSHSTPKRPARKKASTKKHGASSRNAVRKDKGDDVDSLRQELARRLNNLLHKHEPQPDRAEVCQGVDEK